MSNVLHCNINVQVLFFFSFFLMGKVAFKSSKEMFFGFVKIDKLSSRIQIQVSPHFPKILIYLDTLIMLLCWWSVKGSTGPAFHDQSRVLAIEQTRWGVRAGKTTLSTVFPDTHTECVRVSCLRLQRATTQSYASTHMQQYQLNTPLMEVMRHTSRPRRRDTLEA